MFFGRTCAVGLTVHLAFFARSQGRMVSPTVRACRSRRVDFRAVPDPTTGTAPCHLPNKFAFFLLTFQRSVIIDLRIISGCESRALQH